MHVLFVIDPLPGLSAYKDTSVGMMRALQARGHTLSVCLQSDIFIEQGTVKTVATGIELKPDADFHGNSWWSERSPATDTPLAEFSAVLMRKDPPFDLEYFYATHMVDTAVAQGAKVFNSGQAMRDHPEKLAITEFSEFTAPTLVTSSMPRLREFYQAQGDIVVKPLDGMGGTGVFRVKPNDGNLSTILEMLTDMGSTTIMAQRYIPAIEAGDKRIIIINGAPVPYSLARIPLAGESRGNLAAGGRGVAQPLTERDWEIANALGPVLAERGLLVIGLDVIGDYLTEVNVTSPTCFVEITEQTDFHVSEAFALALESAVSKP